MLIGSAEQLDYCKQANSLSDLLMRIKLLWSCNHLRDEELLREIALLNQTPIQTSSVNLVGMWLPYRYQSKQQLINWLIPSGHATEPFQDEYISRCRQQLINQIIQPCMGLDFALQQTENLASVTPAGFIFHLSRCGSTLISGCLSELDSTCVFSESPLLTELLLDNNLSSEQQKTFLRAFINLQAAAFSDRPQMIIKWNAWDIFRWELIRDLYPQVPVIFLVRDPVEILASHQRSAGRHMAGDMSLVHVHAAFKPANTGQTFLAWQSGVLGAFLGEMNRIKHQNAILRVDYKSLDVAGINEICHHFGLHPYPERFTQRLKFHSKTPQVIFSSDVKTKQRIFSADDKKLIQHALLPLHQQFLNRKYQK
jgi:hypothetical protein